jgi:hypothetical protein
MQKRRRWLSGALLCLLSLGFGGLKLVDSAPAFSRAIQPASPTPLGPTATLLPAAIGPTDYPPNVNPLTGLPVADPEVLNRRPLAVKVSNAPAIVRPQAGLSQADLVFEHYTEGSLTRFTAIFYTYTPLRVGSVRSARLIDLQLVGMYGALFAYAGASGPIRERIAASSFSERAFEGVSVGEPLYYRDETIEPPHNLFTVPAEVWAAAERAGVNGRPILEGMTFRQEPPPDDSGQAGVVVVDYGPDVVRWLYDATSGLYYRFVNDELQVDALDGTPLSAANVVILAAHHQTDYTIVESEWQGSKSYSIQVKLWFEGDAMLFRDGKRYDVRWWRPTREGMLMLVTADGKPVYMKPGNTWFQVVRLPEQQDPAEEGVAVE